MLSRTQTLLDPFEIAGLGPARARMPSLLDQVTEWFDRASLPFLEAVQEYSESPPWTPEPVDRRWRARGWTDE